MTREKTIIRTSVIGIGVNVLLAVFKLIVGSISGSIAIVLDAVNNLSDSLSSIVTIIGTKLAGKRPDKTHPFGYGRVEYLSATVISVIILYAGITSLIESVKQIINPVEPEYTNVTLIIVAVAVIIKFLLGRYFVRVGKEVKASSLVASGKDASLDALVSLTTLIAAAIFILWHVSLEAYLGAFISLLLIRAGIQMLKETLSQILGERPERAKALEVKGVVESFSEVFGAYDMVLHNYGPDSLVGSVHIEVPDTMTADGIDRLERKISERVYAECNVILTGISIYARNTTDAEAVTVRDDIYRRVMSHDHVLQLHGYYQSEEEKRIRFDVVIDFAAPDRERVYNEVVSEIKSAYPDYEIIALIDADVSDRE